MGDQTFRRLVVKVTDRTEVKGRPTWGGAPRVKVKKMTCILECGHSVEKNESEMVRRRPCKSGPGEVGLYFICPWCECGEQEQDQVCL